MLSGSTACPEVAFSQSANCALASRLACRKERRNAASSASRLQLGDLAEIGDPAVADRVGDDARQRRIGQQQPAPRRDAIGLVVEALREHLRQVANRRLAQQLGMDRRDAVGAVRADDRQIGHADLVLRPLLDQAHALDAGLVAGKAAPHVVEEAPVDLVDDLELPRQHLLEVVQRPFFQRLGQQRVVRVGQGPLREVPRLLPAELRLVEQDAHQLRHRQGGMGIVELDRDLVGKLAPVGVVAAETAHEVGQRAGDQEIFLREAQPLSHLGGVVRVEHAGQRLRRDAADQGADEVARAELLEVEVVVRRGAPQPQAVDGLAAEADHGPVVGNADQGRGAIGDDLQVALVHLEGAAELDLDGLAAARDLPRVLPAQPVVRMLALPAVLDRLPEHAVLVAQAVAHRRKLHGRHRIEEAGGQPSEAAIAEPGIGLLLDQAEPVEAALARGALDERMQHQVRDVVGQRPADQELHRQVVDPLRVFLIVGAQGLDPALRENVAHRAGQQPRSAVARRQRSGRPRRRTADGARTAHRLAPANATAPKS